MPEPTVNATAAPAESASPTDPDRLPVVAIGASAGGLEALEKLFTALDPGLGAAYVVVQHLSSDHKSMMDTLLARRTSMPVRMVEDGDRVAADQVFLIPPGSTMTLEGDTLRLKAKAPHTLTLPIDIFMESLAEARGAAAVGVILSGTGSDGTRGAAALNLGGGLVLAQHPDTAAFDGMPHSVITAGLADAVLAPDEIARRLATCFAGAGLPEVTDGESVAAVGAIVQLVSDAGGIDFHAYKPGTIERRIQRRIGVRERSGTPAYLALLREDPAEAQALKRELLIPVTRFFRDPEAFESLRDRVLAPLIAQRDTGQPLRVWCAGVATGEEAYSVGMLLLEACERAKRWPAIKVFATDVESSHIEQASAGRYPESIAAELPLDLLERYFTLEAGMRVVRPALRQLVVFARHDLLNDPPFTRMDLVVCRNLLIYLRNEAQARVLRRLHYALAPRGCLLLGSSEALGELAPDFDPVDARNKLWRMLRPATHIAPPDRRRGPGTTAEALKTRSAVRAQLAQELQGVADRGRALLAEAYAPPPAMLLNQRLELTHAYGRLTGLVQVRDGQATLELARLLPPALSPVAIALLHRAAREGVPLRSAPVPVAAEPG